MSELRHSSPSAINRFVRCGANWLLHYDENDGVKTRNDYADSGILAHEALEVFHDPRNDYDITNFKQLEEIFREVCRKSVLRENLLTYKRAYDVLVSGFRMELNHPIVPYRERTTLSVEQPLVLPDETPWQAPGWPLPVVGYIDRVSLRNAHPGGSQTLIIHDIKTGYHKSKEEIVVEDAAASIYFLYAREVLVPFLQATTGVRIGEILGLWDYIAHDLSIVLEESDFDHGLTESYIENISGQMLELRAKYNKHVLRPIRLTAEHQKAERNAWLVKHEKPNPYCGYCPRKNVCTTFQNLLKHDGIIDLDHAKWEEIWREREIQTALAKSSKQRLDEINDLVKFHLDYNNQSEIPVPELGVKIIANRQKWKKFHISGVRKLFGDDFIFRNVDISNEVVQRELNTIAKIDPMRAKEITSALPTAYTLVSGSRPVKAVRLRPPSDKKEKTHAKRFKLTK